MESDGKGLRGREEEWKGRMFASLALGDGRPWCLSVCLFVCLFLGWSLTQSKNEKKDATCM